ncbi:MAG: C1 family peptidase [Lachnospiraceae bacterium]|nr:C1 family peptidase [Lachnospiraceae bacterium]
MAENFTKEITEQEIESFRSEFRANAVAQAMMCAMRKTEINDLLCTPVKMRNQVFQFSNEIKTMKATAQKSTGRCWLFAGMNVMREHLGKQLDIAELELSQSYMAFWDKFERCNYFLEIIIETAHLPLDDRALNYVLKDGGVPDGGQWDMISGLIRKHGLVPKDIMPETAQSSNTRNLNHIISSYLRKNALVLRDMVAEGRGMEEIRARKKEILSSCWSFLASAYSEPPETFDFEYTDKNGAYHRVGNLTPITFRNRYFGGFWDDFVSLINAPTPDKPFDRTYTVKYLGNIAEDPGVLYLNLTMEELKQAVVRQLQDGEIVWFGSDCGKYASRDECFWNDEAFQTTLLTGLDGQMEKGDMLQVCDGRMNHAMCITGVNIGDDGKPNRWKIENSWGSEGLHDGYFVATDSWFDKYVFQAAVHKKYLGEKAALLSMETIVLEPWDPMGSLAD